MLHIILKSLTNTVPSSPEIVKNLLTVQKVYIYFFVNTYLIVNCMYIGEKIFLFHIENYYNFIIV